MTTVLRRRRSYDTFNVVRDYGADFTATTSALTAFQNTHDAISAASPRSGGVMQVPAGVYYLSGILNLSAPNMRMAGDGAGGGIFANSSPGSTHVMLGPGAGVIYNLSGASGGFASPKFEGVMFSPLMTKSSGSYTGGATLTAATAYQAYLPLFPSSGSIWIKSGNNLAKLAYTSVTSTGFAGITVTSETFAGATYASGSPVVVDGVGGGLKFIGTSNVMCEDLAFNAFMDQGSASYGLKFDGTTTLCQYGIVRECWFGANYRGAVENITSTRWRDCKFEGDNGGNIVPNTKCHEVTDPRGGWTSDGCVYVNGDTLLDLIGGASSTGAIIKPGHVEGWTNEAIKINTVTGAYLEGGSFSNSINSNAGYAITLGSGVTSCDINPGNISNTLADRFQVDAAATGVIRWRGGGSPEGVIQATKGSQYHDISGGKLYIKETAATTKTGWVQK